MQATEAEEPSSERGPWVEDDRYGFPTWVLAHTSPGQIACLGEPFVSGLDVDTHQIVELSDLSAGATFDHAWANNVLGMAGDPVAMMWRLFHMVRPGGTLILTVPLGVSGDSAIRERSHLGSVRRLVGPLFDIVDTFVAEDRIGVIGRRRPEPDGSPATSLDPEEPAILGQHRALTARVAKLASELAATRARYRSMETRAELLRAELQQGRQELSKIRGRLVKIERRMRIPLAILRRVRRLGRGLARRLADLTGASVMHPRPTAAPDQIAAVAPNPSKPAATARPAVARSSAASVAVGGRSPLVDASAESMILTDSPAWFDADLLPGQWYRLRALTEGTALTGTRAAVLRFDVVEGALDAGNGLSLSSTIGPYLCLATGPGPARTDRLFTVVKRVRRCGLMLWDDGGPATVRTLTIEKVDGPARPADFFVSFDVEALPGCAPADLIDRLVWGKLDGGQYGIGRICNILGQYGLTANFMIDYSSCVRDGDPGLRAIVDFLAGRGHEVHAHLHAEWLARWWGLEGDDPLYLDGSSYEMSRRMLDYTMLRHEEFTGRRPRAFRAGGRVNPQFVLAAGALGLEAMTNIRNDMISDGIAGDVLDAHEPFVWDNGVIEIPVDLSPEPLSEPFEKYLGRFDSVVRRKTTEPTFNLVMHSWSLMSRNEHGVYDTFNPVHEQRLHEICDHIVNHGTAQGYAEYLDQHHLPRPMVRLSHIAVAPPEPRVWVDTLDVAACNVCDARFDRASMTSDLCPGCGSRARHRQLRSVMDTYGNVFDGRSILACNATPMEQFGFLRGASIVVNFDVRPVHNRDLQMDIQHMDLIEDTSFDCFLAMHVLNHVRDDAQAINEVARVLRIGGVFVSTVPYLADGATVTLDDVTETYGTEAFEEFGVGSYRQYGREDYRALLATHFEVSSIPGIDPVTNDTAYIFFAYKA